MIRAALVVIALCGVAGAEAKQPAPDPIADEEAAEANLVSDAPRSGLVFAFAIGPGLLLGGDIGVGRGGAVSARIGHVATRKLIITFELAATGALHKQSTDGRAVTDTNAGLLAGVQRYASRSTWLRVAAGLDVFSANIGGVNPKQSGGVAALGGGGLDVIRWGYVVLGFEVFGVASITGDGFKVNTGFCLGLSYY